MKKVFILSALVYSLVLLINDGFMASDEYWTAMTRYLPAQSAQIKTLVSNDDVKSPLQILPMYLVAKTSYLFGVESPYWQYRIVIVIIALINLSLLAYSIKILSELFPQDERFYWLIFTFYFAAPFIFTRPMFESLAAPWLFLSVAFGTRYDLQEKISDLLLATFAVSVAFVLRQQVGVCAIGLLTLTLYKKRHKDFFICGAFGLLLLILSGIPDYFIRGKFHYSLFAVTTYNFAHGHEYGDEPWTYYPLMILAITFAPFFIFKYSNNFWQKHLKDQRMNISFIFLFVLLHSLFPQKFERFLISIIPSLLFFMARLFHELYLTRSSRKIRWYGLLVLNFVLFIPSSFSPAQKNIIDLARYLNAHKNYQKVYSVNESLSWIPDIFVEKSRPGIIQIKSENLDQLNIEDCSSLIVVNSHFEDESKEKLSRFKRIHEFSVNYLEKISYELNKKNNLRRTALIAYSCSAN